MDKDCIFCKILSGELESHTLYRDEKCAAFLDIQPVNPGHTLIIPIEHHAYVSDIPDDIVSHMFVVGKKVTQSLYKSNLKCEGVNFFLADGEAAMQEVFHSHLHVFPRFKGDGFGLKHSPEYFTKPSWESLGQVAKLIHDAGV
jgi:histidine triad (HIT) family protein